MPNFFEKVDAKMKALAVTNGGTSLLQRNFDAALARKGGAKKAKKTTTTTTTTTLLKDTNLWRACEAADDAFDKNWSEVARQLNNPAHDDLFEDLNITGGWQHCDQSWVVLGACREYMTKAAGQAAQAAANNAAASTGETGGSTSIMSLLQTSQMMNSKKAQQDPERSWLLGQYSPRGDELMMMVSYANDSLCTQYGWHRSFYEAEYFFGTMAGSFRRYAGYYLVQDAVEADSLTLLGGYPQGHEPRGHEQTCEALGFPYYASNSDGTGSSRPLPTIHPEWGAPLEIRVSSWTASPAAPADPAPTTPLSVNPCPAPAPEAPQPEAPQPEANVIAAENESLTAELAVLQATLAETRAENLALKSEVIKMKDGITPTEGDSTAEVDGDKNKDKERVACPCLKRERKLERLDRNKKL